MIKYNHWLPKLVSNLFMPILGITIYPNIYFKMSEVFVSKSLIRHESIHIEQYKECGVIGFLLIYSYDYLYSRLYLCYDHYDSYMNIRFEQEAHNKQDQEDYLENRKKNAWKEYRR